VAAAAEALPLVPEIEAVLGRTGLLIGAFDGTAAGLLDGLCEVCSEAERRARWFRRGYRKWGARSAASRPYYDRAGSSFCPARIATRSAPGGSSCAASRKPPF
jgi:hypothetical protein